MARLAARGGAPFRFRQAAVWALSWALGAAAGVALGAWLTVIGEAGAPGIEALDPGLDLVFLPLGALTVVFFTHLALQVAAAWLRVRLREEGPTEQGRTPSGDRPRGR